MQNQGQLVQLVQSTSLLARPWAINLGAGRVERGTWDKRLTSWHDASAREASDSSRHALASACLESTTVLRGGRLLHLHYVLHAMDWLFICRYLLVVCNLLRRSVGSLKTYATAHSLPSNLRASSFALLHCSCSTTSFYQSAFQRFAVWFNFAQPFSPDLFAPRPDSRRQSFYPFAFSTLGRPYSPL